LQNPGGDGYDQSIHIFGNIDMSHTAPIVIEVLTVDGYTRNLNDRKLS